MKSIEAEFVRPDSLSGVNHMRGMQYQIYHSAQFLHKTSTLIYILNALVTSYDLPG